MRALAEPHAPSFPGLPDIVEATCRSVFMPEVPTFRESGVADMSGPAGRR